MEQIKSTILNNVKSKNAGKWLDDLVDGDDDCKRLALCLGIEIRKKGQEVLDINHLNEVLNYSDYDTAIFKTDKSYPRIWFAKI